MIVSHSSSTSVRNIEHFSQNLIHKRFNRFDYGSEENLNRYGTVNHLNAKLQVIWNFLGESTRISFECHIGANAYLVWETWLSCRSRRFEKSHWDFKLTGNSCARRSSNIKLLFQDESFELNYNHLDFLWAGHVREQLYNYIID